MAETRFNAGLEVTRWRKELFTQAKNDTYFSRFFGGSDSAIQVLTDLKGAKGHKVRFGLKMKIEGLGITGDNTLAGNEVALDTYYQEVTLDQLRQGVLSTGKMADKKTLINFRKEALDSLKIWFAETMEKDMIDVLTGATSTINGSEGGNTSTYAFGNNTHTLWNDNGTILTTTPAGSMVATGVQDKITPALISAAKAYALLKSPKFRPVRVDGKDYFLMIIHPESAHHLKQDTTWLSAQQYAMPRGPENPLFSGALGMWDGVVIHEHDQIHTSSVNSVHANLNLFLGAQAGCVAFGGDHDWHEETVDRGNKLSVSAAIIYEMARCNFNSSDFSTMVLPCNATKLYA